MMIDKLTMKGVLTYDSEKCETFEQHIIQQVRCLKEACFLIDDVLENYKVSIKQLREVMDEQIQYNNFNAKSICECINDLLTRIAKLERKNNGYFL